jgi:hypothetical protein
MTSQTQMSHPPLKIERTLTLGVMLALSVQTGGALIWAGAASERLEQMERRLDAQDMVSGPVNERLARLEAHAVHASASLERIERKLDEGG